MTLIMVRVGSRGYFFNHPKDNIFFAPYNAEQIIMILNEGM